MSDESSANRAVMRLIALGVAVFAAFVAIGTYLNTGAIVPSIIIVTCAFAFLALWHFASCGVTQRETVSTVGVGEPASSTSLACIGGFLLSITAWGLAIAGDFFTITTSRAALFLLTLTASTCLAAFMLAILGISSPAQRTGKGLGIVAVAAAIGLVVFATVRLMF